LVYFCAVTKGERTRQHIIEATAPLFNTKGFEGTSLADLCEATGLTKGALYGSFENKEELSKEAFYYTLGKMRSIGKERVRKKKTNKQKLIAYLDFFACYVMDPPVPGGCPMMNTAVEADDYHTLMKKIVARELQQSVADLTYLLDSGKKAGEFRKDMPSKEIAYLFFCSVEGAIMFSRAAASEEAMKNVVKNLKRMIHAFSVTK
jgi:TetR/AcrR family transcriptional regulator, transcriptional repressor for nem operon